MSSFTSCFTVFAEEMDLNLDNIAKYLKRGTGIGKILKRLKLDDENVQAGVLAFRSSEFASQIELTSNFSDIEGAYSCIDSCMTNYAQECAKFYSHPSLDAQGIKVALFCQHGQIMGRCVVNTLTMKRSSHYTFIGYEEFDVGLTELGFHSFDDNGFIEESVWSGINLKSAIQSFIPYNDGGGELFQSESAALYLDADIEDGNPTFSNLELELILQGFERAGYPVSDVSQLKMWTGSRWLSYGIFAANSEYWVDWNLTIYRTKFGYHTFEYGENVSPLQVLDDFGNLVNTDIVHEVLYLGQIGVWDVKRNENLWWHQMPV